MKVHDGMTGMFLAMISIGGSGDVTEGLLGLAAFVLGLLCVGCHAVILLRMPVLGEK